MEGMLLVLAQELIHVLEKGKLGTMPVDRINSLIYRSGGYGYGEKISCPLGGLDWAAHSGNGIEEPV